MKIEVINKKIDTKLISTKSGCYIMKDINDKVIYVGKANNLRSRVRSYFSNSHKYPKTIHLVSKISYIELFITENSLEALILESNLIKKYNPKYNVMLKDGKSYPYVKITVKEDFPQVLKVRKVINDGSKYFGPFPYEGRLNKMLKVIERAFPIRKCRKLGKKLCLNFHIERCVGPCVGLVTKEKYFEMIEEILDLFKGNISKVIKLLTDKMKKASDELRFEDAAELRDQALSIKGLFSKQNIENTKGSGSEDIIVCKIMDENICCQVFFIREGKLVGKRHFSFPEIVIPPENAEKELLFEFITRFYEDNYIPDEIITKIELTEELKTFIGNKRDKKIKFIVSEKGRKKHLLNMAEENAEAFLNINKIKLEERKNNIDALYKELKLSKIPERIEVYDISNISGKSAVGSMIVVINGEFCKKEYRKFKIKTLDSPDDFGMLREVIKRRLKRIKTSNWPIPDLMIIDGGKGQLSSVIQTLKKENYFNKFDVVSLAKREEEIFKPNEKEPIILKKNTELFYFVQRIRDEAHRFAIGYFRKLHTKKNISSVLDNIKGIGKQRRNKLLNYFGSIEKISSSDPEIISKVCNISLSLSEEIINFLSEKIKKNS